MTSAYNGLEDRLRKIGDSLRSPPTSVDELLPLLDRTERLLLKVEQSPSQSMINAIRLAMNALVAEELLRHPNVDVRVSVASCTSEITRITAPDPPYDDDLMKVVFQRIVEAFEKLDDMSSSLYSKRVSILETMARFRSCVVMLDLECDDLILHMFHHFLNTIRLNHPENVFSSMETIMTLVVEESEDISPELVSCLLESLKKDSKELNPTAFRLAEKVVSNCGVKLNPTLIKLVQNTSLSNYSKVVGSLCQENSDATDCTDINDSGKNVADDSKLYERAVSDELPQASPQLGSTVKDGVTESSCNQPESDNMQPKEITESEDAAGELSLQMDHREEAGPVDPSVLSDQASHRSSYVRAEGYAPVQFTEHGRKLNSWTVEHPGVVDLLRQAGFFYVSRLRRVQLDQALLGALTERWRRETESFHLRHGEMTVTLRDVAIIAGLRVSGEPVTGRVSGDWLYICHRLLGMQPDDVVAGQIRLDWLFQQFHHVALDAPPAVVAAAARAYILFQIGCSLFPNPTGYRVHLKWLPLLEDFDLCGGLAWGAATLAHLYCALGNASMMGRAECCAFGTLLQIWAWDHIRIGRPHRVGAPPDLHVCPLGSRWNMRLRFRENVRATDIEFYRDELDQHLESQIIWIPYTEEILRSLPSFCLEGSAVWRARTCLICFNIVELHLPDRVLRQFGLVQHIPEPVEAIRQITSQDRSGEDWAAFHISYILRWADRLNNIVEQSPFVDPDPVRATSLYMQWYWKITRRWIFRPVQRSPLTFLPQGHIERILVDIMRRTSRSLRHVIDDLPEPSGMIDVLEHIMWDIENALERLPTLAVSGYSEHLEPPPYFYHLDDVLFTSTPAYDFPSASVSIHPSDVPSTSDVLYFDF